MIWLQAHTPALPKALILRAIWPGWGLGQRFSKTSDRPNRDMSIEHSGLPLGVAVRVEVWQESPQPRPERPLERPVELYSSPLCLLDHSDPDSYSQTGKLKFTIPAAVQNSNDGHWEVYSIPDSQVASLVIAQNAQPILPFSAHTLLKNLALTFGVSDMNRPPSAAKQAVQYQQHRGSPAQNRPQSSQSQRRADTPRANQQIERYSTLVQQSVPQDTSFQTQVPPGVPTQGEYHKKCQAFGTRKQGKTEQMNSTNTTTQSTRLPCSSTISTSTRQDIEVDKE